MTTAPVQPPAAALPVPSPARTSPKAKPRWPRSLIPSPSTRRRWLRSLNPLRLLPGAVFEKEVRAQGRRWGTYIARGSYGLLLLGLMGIMFAVFVSEQGYQSGARGLQEFQTLAPRMTTAVLWFQFVVLTLIAPTLLGAAICDEKRSGTLATLLTTPLTAAQIILGKLAGGLVQIVILALIATPMLLVIRVFGGVPTTVIFAGLSVGLSMAILAACLALAASVTAKRASSAAVTGFLLALLFHSIPAIVMALMRGKPNIKVPLELIFGSSSPCQMYVMTLELLYGGRGFIPIRTEWLWVWNSLYSLTIATIAIVIATARLRRVMLLEGAGAPSSPGAVPPTASDPAPKGAVPPRSPGAIARPPRVTTPRRASNREVGQHPVLWRELRQPVFKRRWQMPVLAALIGGLLFWIYFEVGIHDGEINEIIAAFGMVLGILIAASAPVAAITSEREARTWETLLTTRLSAREIILGKVAGALKRQWFLPALLGADFLLAGVLTGSLHPIFLLHYALLFAVPMIFLSCTGVLASLIVKRNVQAAVLNVGLALAVWLGIPILYALFEGIGGRRWMPSRQTQEMFLIFSNPVPFSVIAATGATPRGSSGGGWLTYNLPGMRGQSGLGVGSFTLLVLAHALTFGLLALGAFAVAVRMFRRVSGRSS